MRREDFTLHFSMPLTSVDWQNLALARPRRVMLTLSFADVATVNRLHSEGVRHITVRCHNNDLLTHEGRDRVARRVADLATIGVDSLVAGAEPENGVQFEYRAVTWQQGLAGLHAQNIRALRDAFVYWRVPGHVKIITPGWTARSISEDEPAQPGRISWLKLTSDAYNECEGCGWHLYGYSWRSDVDWQRVRWALKMGQEYWHKPLWLDEVGFHQGSESERVSGYVELATMLLTHPLGRRVEMFCPFVCNGVPGAWDAGFLIMEPASYRRIGQFINGSG